MQTIKPPTELPKRRIVFLGGSIEQGVAVDWQAYLTEKFAECDVTFLNPRRDNWDKNWRQDPTPGTNFHTQVSWELAGQEMADICVYVFDANTMSPVTLLEVGLYVRTKVLFVCCPKGFWRYGNVKMTFDKYAVPGSVFVEELDDLIVALKERLDNVSS